MLCCLGAVERGRTFMKFETCHRTTARCQLRPSYAGMDLLGNLARRTLVLLLALLTDGTMNHGDEGKREDAGQRRIGWTIGGLVTSADRRNI